MNIHYISHGPFKSGGYRHEKILFDSLTDYYSKTKQVESKIFRKETIFGNVIDYTYLILWSYFKSRADINITSARCAISSIIRNRFNNKQTWIVLHNFDPNDNKSLWMKWYYSYLFKLLSKKKRHNVKVIAVSPFWVQYFSDTLKLHNVFLFPNLFDLELYKPVATSKKNNWVHLGQFSSKNSEDVLKLAKLLKQEGYYCYFSTLNELDAKKTYRDFDVIKFESFKDYLEHMARCKCTVALSKVNEGWNRLAHESLLVGTPVIGYNKGGLGDLLKQSNSVIVNSVDEAVTCINESLWVLPEPKFIESYSIEKAPLFIANICQN
jgi:glycosyltransferase involved in cell wall biosynthesis